MVTVAAAHRCETQGAHIPHLSASDWLNFTTYTLPLGGRGGVINGDFQVLWFILNNVIIQRWGESIIKRRCWQLREESTEYTEQL